MLFDRVYDISLALALYTLNYKVYKQLTYLGAFGAPTVKAIYIWSNTPAVAGIARPRPDVHPEDHQVAMPGCLLFVSAHCCSHLCIAAFCAC